MAMESSLTTAAALTWNGNCNILSSGVLSPSATRTIAQLTSPRSGVDCQTIHAVMGCQLSSAIVRGHRPDCSSGSRVWVVLSGSPVSRASVHDRRSEMYCLVLWPRWWPCWWAPFLLITFELSYTSHQPVLLHGLASLKKIIYRKFR